MINQDQKLIVGEIRTNPKRWAELSEGADKPMLAKMKLSELQDALKQKNLSRKVMGEALDRVEKIGRRIGSANSHGQSMSRSRGRSR